MSKEQPPSKSDNYGFNEEWEAVGELGGIVGESTILVFEIMGGILGDVFGDFSNDQRSIQKSIV